MHLPLTKPKLRGVSHLIAFFCAIIAGAWIIQHAETPRAKTASWVYGLSLAFLYGVSALYHNPNWRQSIRIWLRRLDHTAIYIMIAGNATALALTALPQEAGNRLTLIMWIVAAIGTFKALFWIRAPKAVSAIAYIVAGLATVPYFPQFYSSLMLSGLIWILLGGLLYAIGAVIYAVKRPNPFPRIFGYHEIFHLLVIAGSICHFVVFSRILSES